MYPFRKACVFCNSHNIRPLDASILQIMQEHPIDLLSTSIGRAAEAALRKKKLILRGFEFILEVFPSKNHDFISVIALFPLRIHAVGLVIQSKFLPGFPYLITESIYNCRETFNCKHPGSILSGNIYGFCPLEIVLRETEIPVLFSQRIGKYEVYTRKSKLLNNVLGTVLPQGFAIKVISDRIFNCPCAPYVFLVTLTPQINFIIFFCFLLGRCIQLDFVFHACIRGWTRYSWEPSEKTADRQIELRVL